MAVYPNPFMDSAVFFFQLTHDAEVDLKVFTTSGRKIWETSKAGEEGPNRIRWDGRDRNGRNLANGTYLFKVEATYTDPASQSVESDEFVGHVVRMN